MKLPFPGIRSSAAARKEEEEKKSSSGTDSASRSTTRNNSGTKASSSNPAGGLAALGKAFMQFASTDTGKAVISGALTTGAGFAYDKVVFSRYERPDYRTKPGVYCFERVTNGMPRKEVDFPSDGVMLRGYFYQNKNPKGLVVVCHGIHSGSDDYLPITCYMWENGFDVFSFNYRGTYESQGEGTRGMSESLVDLDHALTYLENIPQYSSMPIMLVGHSWGGFAVSSVLSLHTSVRACAVISGFNSGYTMIEEKGKEYTDGKLGQGLGNVVKGIDEMVDNPYVKMFAGLTDLALNSPAMSKPFLDSHQSKLFGDYVNYTGVMGINNSGIPVLVAHGNRDMVISINHQSIFAHKDEITNPNVIWYTGTGSQSGHDTIWHSDRANQYQDLIKRELKAMEKTKGRELTDEEKANYVSGIDHEKYSEINYELFDKIIEMFNKVSKRSKLKN